MNRSSATRAASRFLHGLQVLSGAVALALAFFLILPVMQTITKRPAMDVSLRKMTITNVEEDEVIEEEVEEEEEEEDVEEEQPEFEEHPPMDLSQLQMTLEPGFGGTGPGAGQLTLDLAKFGVGKDAPDELFSMADLDQKPRAIYRPHPIQNARTRKKAPGKVHVVFVVDERGRVQNPQILSASDPVFERPSLDAVKKWKFEPGKKNGKPVQFRMRSPITFPKG